MGRFLKTFILGGIVLIFGAYVIWDFTSQLENDGSKSDEVSLFPNLGEIGEIRLKNPQGSVKMIFADGACRILEPIQDQCDSSSSESLRDQLQNLKGRKLNESASLDQMGLAEGQGTTISFLLKSGQEHNLRIGEKNTFDGKFYAQVGADIFVLEASAAQLTNKGLRQFQDMKLWRADFPKDQVEGVDVRVDFENIHESYKLRKSGDVWTLLEPKDEREVSSPAVQGWLVSLTDLRGQDVKMEKMEGKAALWVTFLGPEQKKYEMQVSIRDREGFYWVSDLTQTRTLKISGDLLSKIATPYSNVFDGRKPFQFSLEQAQEITVIKSGQKDSFKKSDQKWIYEGKKTGFKEVQLPEFFSKLRQLEVQTYLKPQAWFGLDHKKDRLIRVVKADGSEILSFTWGEKFKPNQGPKKGMDLIYVQVQGQKWVFGVKSEQLDELLNVSLFGEDKPKEKANPAEEHEHVH